MRKPLTRVVVRPSPWLVARTGSEERRKNPSWMQAVIDELAAEHII